MKAIGLNKKGRNIFLITTPLQFILANLIKISLKIEAEFIVLTNYEMSLIEIKKTAQILGGTNYQQLSKCLKTERIKKLKLLFEEIKRYLKILKFKSTLSLNDNVFIGFAHAPIVRPIIFGHKKYNLIFFDDGTASIHFLNRRKNGNKGIRFPRSSMLYFYTRFYPESIVLDKITYYTIYPGLKGGPDDIVVHFDATLPQDIIRSKKRLDELWFIGGPLVENRVIEAYKYAEIVTELKKTCEKLGIKFVYFAHRTEKWIYSFSGIDIRKPDLPWELFFATSNVMPKIIVSVISSALLNLSIMLKPPCPLINLKIEGFALNDVIKEIQNYGRNELNIPLLTLPQLKTFLIRTKGNNTEINNGIFKQ